MADTDSGGLLVQIGVTQARMERELAKLVSAASKSAQKMEDDFKQANDNIASGATNVFSNYSRGANSAAPAVKNLSGYTANLASQLNDITVQLAGGQSPFQIMLQQGTQIGQIATQAGGGFKALGSIAVSAFTSMLSPVNLATFAVIGLGGAAIQYFGSLVSGGEDSKKTLEEQTKLVEAVAKTWGDAVPALKEYVDNLERAKNVGDLQAVVKQRQDDAKKQLQQLLSDFEANNRVDVGFLVQDSGDETSPVNKLGQAYVDLQRKIQDGTATVADFQKVSDLAAQSGESAVGGFDAAFSSFSGAARGALAVLDSIVSQADKAINKAVVYQEKIQNLSTSGTFTDDGKTYRSEDFIPQGNVPTPTEAPDQTDLQNKALTDQVDLIKKVAAAYDDLSPMLQSYIDANEQATNVLNLRQAVENQQIDTWTNARNSLYAFNDANSTFIDLMSKASANTDDPLHNLAVAYDTLKEKILNGTATTEDFQAVSNATKSATDSGVTGLGEFAAAFDALTSGITNSLTALAQFQTKASEALNTAARVQSSIQDMTTTPRRTYTDENGVQRVVPNSPEGTVVTDDGRYVPTPTPTERPSTEGMYPGGTWTKPRSSRGGSARGAHAYEDEVASINERTAALKASTAAQAAINPLVNDFGYASQKAATEQKLLADAQKAGMEITPQLREQISQLADQYAQASAESKQLAASQEEVKKKAQEFADLEKDTFGGFLKDLKNGKSGAEALSNALNKMSDKLMDMAVNSLFSTKTGTTTASTGLFSSIFSGIGKLFGFASGTANTGGRRGQPVGIVHGEEAVIPLPSGGKVPVTISSPSTSDMAKKSSRDVVDINLTDDSGRMASIADQRIQTHAGTIIRVAAKQSYKQVQKDMPTLMADAQERHYK